MERVQSVLEPQPGPCLRKRPRREALQLRLADFPAVQRQMAQLKAHLQEPLSETRQTEPLANITVQATQRRLLSTYIYAYTVYACMLQWYIYTHVPCSFLGILAQQTACRRYYWTRPYSSVQCRSVETISQIHGGYRVSVLYIMCALLYPYFGLVGRTRLCCRNSFLLLPIFFARPKLSEIRGRLFRYY